MFTLKKFTQCFGCIVYFCIEGIVFGWQFVKNDASFSCIVSSRDVQQAKCLFLPLLAVQEISGVSCAIFITFCVIFALSCKRKWFSKSDFPLDVIETRAAASRNTLHLEFLFLMKLLKQQIILYEKVLVTIRLFLPCYLFTDASLENTIENTREKLLENDAAAARLFALLQGCISGQIRLISMMEFETSPPGIVSFADPVYLYCDLFLRKFFVSLG